LVNEKNQFGGTMHGDDRRARFVTRLAAFLLVTAFDSGPAHAGAGTWTPLGPEGVPIFSFAVDPVTPTTLYAASFDRGYKSVNGGRDWRPFGDGVLPHPISELLIDPTAPGTVYAGSDLGGGRGGVYKSIDGGGSWRPAGVGLRTTLISALAIDPRSPTTLYAGAMEYGCEGPCAFKSTNGAESWVVIGDGRIPADILEMAVSPVDPNSVYAGTYGSGLFKSEDGGDSWRSIPVGPSGRFISTIAIDPSRSNTLYVAPLGQYPGGVFKSSDGGDTWRAVNQGIAARSVNTVAINPRDPETLYAGTPDGVFKSSDAGENWSPINNGLTSSHVTTLTVDPSDPTRLYAGTRGGGVFVFQDSGTCAPNPTTLCLNGGRFAVTAEWFDRDGAQGIAARAVGLTADAGYFTFFDTANVEVLVKVLNGCGVNSRYWTFAAGLTDLEVILTVTDTLTASVRTYRNPGGVAFQAVQDTAAFAACP
jgi:photosystem II stability/assembly factor-like uncharacterized protein